MSSGLSIRPAHEKDRPAIHNVLRDAFRRDAEVSLMEKLWHTGAVTTELVAEEGGSVAGYCAFSAVTATPTLDGLLLGLAPLAVLNAHQGKGVGKALAMRGLAICVEQNVSLMVVLGEPEYYSRFGFTPASDYNVSWAVMDAGRAFQVIDFADITGATPTKISYHPAFSEV